MNHQSQANPGSTFHFTAKFPIQNEKNSPLQKIEQAKLSGKRVLIVDDNTTNRMILRRMLSNWGISHNDVATGEIAIKAMEQAAANGNTYDLVLMDGQMPQMDGFEVSKRIRQNPLFSSTIIIMVTSMGLRGDASRCKEVGIDGYLVKPVKRSELLDAISLVLAATGQEMRPKTKSFVTKHTVREEQRASKLKILIAEDNSINQKMATKILEKQGHEVSVADNGKLAIELLENDIFDLVLMDVQMPVMDGFAATRQIRNLPSDLRNIPIIAMTAHAMKGDREKCLETGMNDYISKPFNPQKLATLLEKWNGRPASGC